MIGLRSILFHTLSLSFLFSLPAQPPVAFKLAPLFRDHMVLQRDKPVPVWGRAASGSTVTVEFKGVRLTAKADSSGFWKVDLPAMSASGESTNLTVTTAQGTNVIHDVVIGDVWLCSGQSNMQFKLSQADNATNEAATANFPLIRNFREPLVAATEPQTDLPSGSWMVCTPSSSKNFSAVAFFFARDIHQTLNVPIGLIDSSWQGKIIEVFMSSNAVNNSGLADVVNQRWLDEVKTQPDPDIYNAHRPGCVFDGMITPTVPYAVRGVIWYQGEQNTSRPEEYHALFSSMITDWRAKFQQGDIPFYYVQLANYAAPLDSSGTGYARLREAQTQTLAVTNTGMAVTIDIGISTNIHPTNKQDVGARLARIAKAKTYNLGGEYSGPVFSSATVQGSVMRVNFDHLGNGLMTTNALSDLGFELAGSNGVFYAAQVELSGAPATNVLLSSASVPAPVSVRYAWGNDPKSGLYNDAGNGVRLPAVPFRFSLSGSEP